MLLLLVFHYLPTLGNVVAFQDYNPYVGDNAAAGVPAQRRGSGSATSRLLFADPAFWDALRNTLAHHGVPAGLLLPAADRAGDPAQQRALAAAARLRPDRGLPAALLQLGAGGDVLRADARRRRPARRRSCARPGIEPWNIMTNPDTFIVLVTAEAVWKDVGWGTIVFLAALSTIDPNLYEAAAVDGAGRWRRLWHITLPGLRPVIVLLLILRLGDALTVGFEQFLLQRDAVGPAGRRGARHVRLLPGDRHRQLRLRRRGRPVQGRRRAGADPGRQQGARTCSASRGCTPDHDASARTRSAGAPDRPAWEEQPDAGRPGRQGRRAHRSWCWPCCSRSGSVAGDQPRPRGRPSTRPAAWWSSRASFDLSAYVTIFAGGQVTQALWISTLVTVVGTAFSLTLTVLAAYGLSRPGSVGHRPLLFFFLLTFLIYPGLVPSYLVVTGLGPEGQHLGADPAERDQRLQPGRDPGVLHEHPAAS